MNIKLQKMQIQNGRKCKYKIVEGRWKYKAISSVQKMPPVQLLWKLMATINNTNYQHWVEQESKMGKQSEPRNWIIIKGKIIDNWSHVKKCHLWKCPTVQRALMRIRFFQLMIIWASDLSDQCWCWGSVEEEVERWLKFKKDQHWQQCLCWGEY